MKISNYLIPKTETLIETIFVLLIFATIIFSFKWSELNDQYKSTNILVSKTNVVENRSYQKYLNGLWNDKDITYPMFVKVIEKHPYVKAARVSKHYPNTIHVEIIERNPIAYLKTDPMIFLDNEGFVLPNEEENKHINLPILTNINPDKNLYPVGGKVMSQKVLKCISLLAEINNQYENLYENISEIRISSDEEVEIILSDEPTHIYFGNENIEERIKHLIKFSKLLKPKILSDFKYLDMRFDNQIIAKERSI